MLDETLLVQDFLAHRANVLLNRLADSFLADRALRLGLDLQHLILHLLTHRDQLTYFFFCVRSCFLDSLKETSFRGG